MSIAQLGNPQVTYRWIEHMSELELELEASTEHGVFEAAFEAMRGVVPDTLSLLELDEGGLRALVQGWEGSPPHLVKGATYHRLRFERAGGRWRGRVVLDV
jgi:SHS2 domain-containing protein